MNGRGKVNDLLELESLIYNIIYFGKNYFFAHLVSIGCHKTQALTVHKNCAEAFWDTGPKPY